MHAMSSTKNHSSMCLQELGGLTLTLYVSGFAFLFFTIVPLTTNLPPFWWMFTSFLRSIPHKNVLFYFKSFRFVASLVALYHSIVNLLAVQLCSSSDLLYFLQVAGQFPFFLALW